MSGMGTHGIRCLCTALACALVAACASGAGRSGPAASVEPASVEPRPVVAATEIPAPPVPVPSAERDSPSATGPAPAPSSSKPTIFETESEPPLGGSAAVTARQRMARRMETEGSGPAAKPTPKPKPTPAPKPTPTAEPGSESATEPGMEPPSESGPDNLAGTRMRSDLAIREEPRIASTPRVLGGESAERIRREMAERAAQAPQIAPEAEQSGGTFAGGGSAEDAFTLLDRSYAESLQPLPAEPAPLGGPDAGEARQRPDTTQAAEPQPMPQTALVLSSAPLPGVAQDEWLRRATRGALDQVKGVAVERPFAPGEFASPDAEVDAHMGRTDRITYLYWTDYHNAVVANAPDKPYAELSFEGGDWHIWCVGGRHKRTRCRVGIAYVDSQTRERLPAMTVFFDPDRTGTTVCVGTGEGGGTVTLTVDRTRPYSAQDGSCFDVAQSRAILHDLDRGSSFVFTRRAPDIGQRTGWLSPFGMEKAMELMAFMHQRLSEG